MKTAQLISQFVKPKLNYQLATVFVVHLHLLVAVNYVVTLLYALHNPFMVRDI